MYSFCTMCTDTVFVDIYIYTIYVIILNTCFYNKTAHLIYSAPERAVQKRGKLLRPSNGHRCGHSSINIPTKHLAGRHLSIMIIFLKKRETRGTKTQLTKNKSFQTVWSWRVSSCIIGESSLAWADLPGFAANQSETWSKTCQGKPWILHAPNQ